MAKSPGSKIKILSLKFFYDVENGATRGNIDDIFDQNAPREAHVQLHNGALSFERP